MKNKKSKFFSVFTTMLLSFSIILNSMNCVFAATLNSTERNNLAQYISELAKIEKRLNLLGGSIADFEPLFDLAEDNQDFFKGVFEYYNSNPVSVSPRTLTMSNNNGDLWDYDENIDLISQRWVYASYISQVNNKRDKNKKSPEEEAIYMYLSHYIDMAPNHVGSKLDYNSNDGFFSAWITNQDRQVYEDYLSYVTSTEERQEMLDVASTTLSAISGATSLYSAPSAISNAIEARNGLTAAVNILNTTNDTVFGVAPAINAIGDELANRNAGDTIPDTIQKIEDNLDRTDVGSELAPLILSGILMTMSILVSVPVSAIAIASFAVGFANLGIKSIKDFLDHVKWTGMIATARGRSSERFMRYIYGY